MRAVNHHHRIDIAQFEIAQPQGLQAHAGRGGCPGGRLDRLIEAQRGRVNAGAFGIGAAECDHGGTGIDQEEHGPVIDLGDDIKMPIGLAPDGLGTAGFALGPCRHEIAGHARADRGEIIAQGITRQQDQADPDPDGEIAYRVARPCGDRTDQTAGNQHDQADRLDQTQGGITLIEAAGRGITHRQQHGGGHQGSEGEMGQPAFHDTAPFASGCWLA